MTSNYALPYHQTMKLQEVFERYEDRLVLVEDAIRQLFANRAPHIPLIGNYILSSGGKRLRPLFHLISADIAGYRGDSDIEIGAIIEMIHTASLLHDDVVDMAEVRRGKQTANSVWGNQVVVLVGDFLYSNALRAAVLQKNQKIMEMLSSATTRMTEGELLQLNRIGDPELTDAEYIEIISAKTGALISAACGIGAILAGLPDTQEKALSEFGMKIGIVFQMADDILDYMANENDLGKRLGKDIAEGKITLPLLLLMREANTEEQIEIKAVIHEFSESGLARIMELLKQYRSIDLSFRRAETLMTEARTALSVFPASPARDALLAIADYSLRRDK
ncbi:MAG: polyprenyl synthetase family protein [Thermodesulfovibrionales bacterium]